MTTTQWLLIILLVLLIAVGIWMLMRKPAAGQDRSPENEHDASHVAASEDGVSSYDAGGEHVAAGDAGVTPGPTLYDQEADARTDEGPSTDAYGESHDDRVSEDEMWDEADAADAEGARQDTATGADVPIVEEEPIVPADQHQESDAVPFDQHDLDTSTDHGEQAEPVSQVHNGDRDQMSYGEPLTEDFASETTYADAPPEETLEPVGEDSAESHDLGAGSPGTGVHDEMLDLENEQALEAEAYSPVDEETPYDMPADAVEREHEGDDVPEDAASAGFAEDLHGSVDEHPGPQEPEADEDAVQTHDDAGVDVAMVDAGDFPTTTSDNHEAAPSDREDTHDDEALQQDHRTDHDADTYATPAVEAEHDGVTEHEGDRHEGDRHEGDWHGSEERGEELDGPEPQVAMVDAEDFPTTTSDDHEAAPADREDTHHDHDAGTPEDRETEARQDRDADTYATPAVEPEREGDRHEGEGHGSVERGEDPDRPEPPVAMVDAEDFPTTTSDDHETAPADRDDTHHDHDAGTPEDRETEAHQDREADVDGDSYDADRTEASDIEHEPISLDAEDQAPADGDVEPTEPSEPEVVESPYGAGSVFAHEDGSVPSGYDIKGNAGSMLFHTPESPSYESSVPEVYFNSEEAARAAGFAHWDRKRR